MNETTKLGKLVKMYLNEQVMLQPQKAAELGRFGHMVLALESRIQKRDYEISLCDKGKLMRPGT